MSNMNPETGIRYGVIAGNKLDPEILQDLTSGLSITYTNAYEDERKRLLKTWQDEFESSTEAASSQTDPEFDILEHVQFKLSVPADIEDAAAFAEFKLEEFSDTWSCDEEDYAIDKDGVKGRVTWLGGAPLVWVFDGLTGYATELCSPCVPGAANLDGGWVTGDVTDELIGKYPHQCYVVPNDWLEPEVNPQLPLI